MYLSMLGMCNIWENSRSSLYDVLPVMLCAMSQCDGAHDVLVPIRRCGQGFAADHVEGVHDCGCCRRSVLDAPLAIFPMASTMPAHSTQNGHVPGRLCR
jgi:hypothetical protein